MSGCRRRSSISPSSLIPLSIPLSGNAGTMFPTIPEGTMLTGTSTGARTMSSSLSTVSVHSAGPLFDMKPGSTSSSCSSSPPSTSLKMQIPVQLLQVAVRKGMRGYDQSMITCVYNIEPPIRTGDGRDEHGKSVLGSMPTVPAVMGMTLANEAIRHILGIGHCRNRPSGGL